MRARFKSIRLASLLVIFIIVKSGVLNAQTILYVKPIASGTADGSSWGNASGDLQAMIDAAGPNTQIWVAEGTYKPTTGTDRSISFSMKNGVTLVSGFSGVETSISQRHTGLYKAILSGQIGDPNTDSDNSYHVIKNYDLDSTAVLDGFTISVGEATGSGDDSFGGGMFCSNSSPTISTCSFIGNFAMSGGALFLRSNSSPIIFNGAFGYNESIANGGAIFVDGQSKLEMINTLLVANTANGNGGAIHNHGQGTILTNCLITGNKCIFAGGGVYSAAATITFINCTISGNSHTTTGGGIYNNTGLMNLKNTIIWGNTSGLEYSINVPIAQNCIIQGGTGFTGSNNLNQDPLFIDQLPISEGAIYGGDYRLQTCSPAINAGTSTEAPAYDLLLQPRPALGGIDIGAYELQSGECVDYGAISRLYVKQNASGAGSGLSWVNAFNNLQDALAVANDFPNVVEIWVGEGAYYPTPTNDRTQYFELKNNLSIYGGFVGTETLLNQRNIIAYPTTLSGNINFVLNDDNSYHVIYASGVDGTSELDGFRISGGYANGNTGGQNSGGAMHLINSSPTIRNCTFLNNFASGSGGAIFGNNSSPQLTDCIFENNSTSGRAGAIHNTFSSNPQIARCTFKNNQATDYGGAIFNYSSSPDIYNCYFLGNSAGQQGGAMHSDNNAIPLVKNSIFTGNSAGNFGGALMTSSGQGGTFYNCTLSGNSAGTNGGAIYAFGGASMQFKNCIVWNNRAAGSTTTASATCFQSGGTAFFEYSIVANSGGSGANWAGAIGVDNGNNLHINPRFVQDVNLASVPNLTGNVRLLACSPAINSGSNALNPTSVDLDGNNRFFNVIDRGAYEYQADAGYCCPAGNVLYVKNNATGLNDGTSWTDAYTSLQEALANSCPAVTQIWVAGGIYYPTNTTDRTIAFTLRNNLGIYGGFAGTETSINQRNIPANTTTLLGNIGNFATNTDNSYHVVVASNVNASAILDGFRIAGGYANVGGSYNDTGGALLITSASPTIRNCSFSLNYALTSGGAVFCNASAPNFTSCIFENNSSGGRAGALGNNANSNSMLESCVFRNNAASTYGGAIFNNMSSPQILKCQFYGNNATLQGGAMHSDNLSSPMVSNSAFTGNNAGQLGGALMMSSSQGGTYTNCTISGNGAGIEGGAMYCFNGPSAVFSNCIIWNNKGGGQTDTTWSTNVQNGGTATFEYCLVANSGGSGNWRNEVGTDGGNNIAMDPLFVQDVDVSSLPNSTGNISITPCSPALNAGYSYFDTVGTDLIGANRFYGIIDLGALELQGAPQAVIYVDSSATGNTDGTSWLHAFTSMESALDLLSKCASTSTMHIAQGTYTTATDFTINREDAVLLGGYLNGGALRDPIYYKTVLVGEVRLLTNVKLDGVTVE